MFQEMGIAFEVMPADLDERMADGETPVEFAVRAAEEKWLETATRLERDGRKPWVVSADTIVVLDDSVMTKPQDREDAVRMLRELSGRTHMVVTGWMVGRLRDTCVVRHTQTSVTFHDLTGEQIDGYVSTGEGMDKAGSYAIQEIGAFLVKRIEGDYFNVVGLPISQVVRALIEFGAIKPDFPGR
jgi:septum formation protein